MLKASKEIQAHKVLKDSQDHKVSKVIPVLKDSKEIQAHKVLKDSQDLKVSKVIPVLKALKVSQDLKDSKVILALKVVKGSQELRGLLDNQPHFIIIKQKQRQRHRLLLTDTLNGIMLYKQMLQIYMYHI